MSKQEKGLNISTRSFITALVIIFVLMVLTYGLTFIIPGGEYARVLDEAGNTVIDTAAGYHQVEGGISFWEWILSPFLVLSAEGSGSLIAVIAFLLVIGGVFYGLDKCGLMRYMLDRITDKFGKNRYALMAVIVFFFMAMGSFIGSFEECVPLVPIVVALAVRLGWDALTGMGMSILAAGCGFAAGVCNPFTIGVAQEISGLPMFSGVGLRMFAFVLIYILFIGFLFHYVKKIEKRKAKIDETASDAGVAANPAADEIFVVEPRMDRGLLCFGGILGVGILLVLSSVFITVLQDYTMIIVALMFLVAGLVACPVAGMKAKELWKAFENGVVGMLPAVLMILMANSIKYTLVEAKVLDTILYETMGVAQTLPKWVVILFIYLLVLIMNFFIPSGSAKAFLLMPLIVPMAQVFGISAQLCVVAFAFGDGFSNVFYPTNPVLLISLGLADVNYVDWAKWSGKFQAMNLILTSAILLFGLAIGYC